VKKKGIMHIEVLLSPLQELSEMSLEGVYKELPEKFGYLA